MLAASFLPFPIALSLLPLPYFSFEASVVGGGLKNPPLLLLSIFLRCRTVLPFAGRRNVASLRLKYPSAHPFFTIPPTEKWAAEGVTFVLRYYLQKISPSRETGRKKKSSVILIFFLPSPLSYIAMKPPPPGGQKRNFLPLPQTETNFFLPPPFLLSFPTSAFPSSFLFLLPPRTLSPSSAQ